MKNMIDVLKRNSKYALLILPVFYLLVGVYFRYIFGDLSLRSVDPDYMHFLSGLCVSTGKFSQANIDHPASTLQFILAVVFRIVYLFRPKSLPYFEDVIINSDMYLSVANLILTTIIAISILIAGYKIFTISSNLIVALLIQSSPFLANILYDIIGRIYPELILTIPIFILIILFFEAIYKEEDERPSVSWFAFAIAFGLATKATFLPVAILPFFVLNKRKQILKYLALTILFYLVLALPVTFQINHYWQWMKGLLLHSGDYGKGATTIIKTEEFFRNMKEIFNVEKAIFYATGILAVLTAIFSRSAKTNKEKNIRNISLGIIIFIFIQTLLISKQYGFRYFVPALLFSPFILFLIGKQITQLFPDREVYHLTSLVLLFLLIRVIVIQFPSIQLRSQYIAEQMQARIESSHVVQRLPEKSYKLIVTQDYGCPFHEFAIMHSFCVAGQNWPNYREKLATIYPKTYQFFTWDNTIKYWGTDFDPADGDQFFMYLENDTPELLDRAMKKFFEGKSYQPGKLDTLFLNPFNHEIIYEAKINRITVK